jgi:DNA-directed RNA polymerase specialized sigma24 family protein
MALSGELQRGAQQLAGRAAEGTRTPYFSGHTRAEVADLSGPSLGAVKSRVRLGLKKVGASPDARGMGGPSEGAPPWSIKQSCATAGLLSRGL